MLKLSMFVDVMEVLDNMDPWKPKDNVHENLHQRY